MFAWWERFRVSSAVASISPGTVHLFCSFHLCLHVTRSVKLDKIKLKGLKAPTSRETLNTRNFQTCATQNVPPGNQSTF